MPNNKLAHISGSTSATKATIVVGGIHDTFKHFETWEQDLGNKDTLLVGFDHNHQSSTMQAASKELAQAIRDLKDQGIDEVTVVAHSMGGLVGKAALDDLAKSGDAADFKSVDFHALGTPWGGFALAGMPLSQTFGSMAGYPMAGEMSPNSQFMQGLSKTDWPENMSFSVYQGSADNVSLPSVMDTHNRYNATTGKANAFVTIEGYDHSDYVQAGAEVLNAGRGADLKAFDTVRDTEKEAQREQATQRTSEPEKAAAKEQETAGMEMS